MKRSTLLLLVFIAAKIILQYLLINPVYELHRDEFLHLDQGRHIAAGYISVPPVTSWFSFFISLLSNSFFLVKFLPALFGALTIVVVWKIVEELNGQLFAKMLAAVALLFSVLLRINMLYQPNSFDIFFWTLFYFTVIKYIRTTRSKWLYWMGITAAFGILSKYNIIFLIAGMLPPLLLTEHSRVFRVKHFYFAVAIAFIIILPNILWQWHNDFPTLRQISELQSTQLVHVERSAFLKEQLLFFFNSIFVLIAAVVAFFLYKPFSRFRVILWSFLVTLLLFTLMKAKNYYAIGLYPVLMGFGSVYLEKLLAEGWQKYLRFVAIICIVVLFVPVVTLIFPVLTPQQIVAKNERFKALGLLRWEDGKDHLMPQDFADMLGWKELAQKVDAAYSTITDKEKCLVLCDNYGEAGAINYYSSFKNINAVSFNADYINWMNLKQPIKHIILIKDETDTDQNRNREKKLFATVQEVGQIDNIYARERGTTIYVLKDAKANINDIIADEIVSRKTIRTN